VTDSKPAVVNKPDSDASSTMASTMMTFPSFVKPIFSDEELSEIFQGPIL
jgi:hypothetical protein